MKTPEILNTTERSKLGEVYSTYFDSDSEHYVGTVFEYLLFMGVIRDSDAQRVAEIEIDLWTILNDSDTELLKTIKTQKPCTK